jgi:hypothetical protein
MAAYLLSASAGLSASAASRWFAYALMALAFIMMIAYLVRVHRYYQKLGHALPQVLCVRCHHSAERLAAVCSECGYDHLISVNSDLGPRETRLLLDRLDTQRNWRKHRRTALLDFALRVSVLFPVAALLDALLDHTASVRYQMVLIVCWGVLAVFLSMLLGGLGAENVRGREARRLDDPSAAPLRDDGVQ